MQKGKIFGIIGIFLLLAAGIFFYLRNGNDEHNMEEAIIEQLGLESSESIESDEPESYINLEETSGTELYDLIKEKCKIDVEDIKEYSVILQIESADLRKIIEETKNDEGIIEKLKSEDCPILKSKVEVKILEKTDPPVIEKNEELLNAIYGGLPSVFGTGGNDQ